MKILSFGCNLKLKFMTVKLKYSSLFAFIQFVCLSYEFYDFLLKNLAYSNNLYYTNTFHIHWVPKYIFLLYYLVNVFSVILVIKRKIVGYILFGVFNIPAVIYVILDAIVKLPMPFYNFGLTLMFVFSTLLLLGYPVTGGSRIISLKHHKILSIKMICLLVLTMFILSMGAYLWMNN